MEKVFFTTAIPVGGRSGMIVYSLLMFHLCIAVFCKYFSILIFVSFYKDGNAGLQKSSKKRTPCVYVMSQLFVLPQGTLCSRLALVSPSSSLSRRKHASVSVPAEIRLKKGTPVRALPPHNRSLETFLHHLQLLQLHMLFQSVVPPK